MKGWSKASFTFNFTVPLYFLTMLACIYMHICADSNFIHEDVREVTTDMYTNALPAEKQNRGALPSASQSPSEEVEEDDDDSNREILLVSSFNGKLEVGKAIAMYQSYPTILLDITTPPPRA